MSSSGGAALRGTQVRDWTNYCRVKTIHGRGNNCNPDNYSSRLDAGDYVYTISPGDSPGVRIDCGDEMIIFLCRCGPYSCSIPCNSDTAGSMHVMLPVMI